MNQVKRFRILLAIAALACVAVLLFWSPAAGSADEHRFIRYAIARFGAYSNIAWDLGDDLDHYRDDRWTHTTLTTGPC